MAIFLCGFMGCGKTTIGKNLAKLLGCGYCDMDELIVKKAGMSIPEIFETKGEKHFRQMESDLIIELGNFKGIVSCGGGAMLNEQNGKNAAENGTVLFLDTPFEICYKRIAGDSNRPIAASRTKEQLEELYNERYPKYLKNAGMRVDCSGTPMEISKYIIQSLKLKK
ncbi:MAG: shikimate kinase [Oscillospiraceae bacterium]|uniref:shikimate kinase n=1 Tax=Porcipelethomonas sp. TaxID=2981675 RepID=UPI0030779BCF